MSSLEKNSPINIVQVTDSHLYGEPKGTLLKMNTLNSLDHVVEMVSKNESAIDIVLATGDIAQDASVAAYEKFVQILSPLAAPFYWIPGNHDIAEVMATVSGDESYCQKTITADNWKIIMLDTSVIGQVHGKLSKVELEFLEAELSSIDSDSETDFCLICLHHNPVPADALWMKDIGLVNHKAFFKTISKFKKVKALLYGHIHQELDFEHQGVRCLCTPSTCIQFKPDVSNFELDKINPGYRNLKLFPDGSIESKVFRVQGQEFEVDLQSAGY